MTMVGILLTLTCCTASALVGYWFASRRHHVCTPDTQENAKPQKSLGSKKDQTDNTVYFDSLIDSLYELTANVDSQVLEHNLRIGEITASLEAPQENGSALVLFAGKMLVEANQKLQVELEEAKAEIQRQREQMAACIEDSRTDALTGIMNRRGFETELNRVFAQRRRDGSVFSILMIDIDYFKKFNDRYGHLIGDQVLKSFARCLVDTFRESDYVFRFGGEEFVVILPRISLSEAFHAAERIRQVVANHRFRAGELEMQLTTSIGVREIGDNETEAELLMKADEALYAAKNAGRNRSCYDDGTQWRFEYPHTILEVSTPRINCETEEDCELLTA